MRERQRRETGGTRSGEKGEKGKSETRREGGERKRIISHNDVHEEDEEEEVLRNEYTLSLTSN